MASASTCTLYVHTCCMLHVHVHVLIPILFCQSIRKAFRVRAGLGERRTASPQAFSSISMCIPFSISGTGPGSLVRCTNTFSRAVGVGLGAVVCRPKVPEVYYGHTRTLDVTRTLGVMNKSARVDVFCLASRSRSLAARAIVWLIGAIALGPGLHVSSLANRSDLLAPK